MEITAVNMARVMGFFPAGREITIGRVPIDAAAKFLRERYGFMQYPKTLEEWTKTDGAIFGYGQMDGVIIGKLTIYARGLVVETQTGTDDCERVIEDLLSSAGASLAISVSPQLRRKVYTSELTFVSDSLLSAINPALAALAAEVQPFVAPIVPGCNYEVAAISLNVDDTNIKYGAGPFRIERRSGVEFSENTYYSVAPMPTGAHVKALENLEAALKQQR